MKIFIESDYERLSKKASDIVALSIHDKRDALLVLPTGDTPVGMYNQLLELQHQQALDFSQVRLMVLDEWGGLGREHPLSCSQIIESTFARPAGIKAAKFHSLDGAAPDPKAECQRYSQLLAAIGPIDLAVLGLGPNGHIGFNEPADSLPAKAHVVPLAPPTIARAKSRMGADGVPIYGLTLGMAQIMQAKQVLLLASGHQKSDAVSQMLTGPITTEFPASLLQLHSAATFLMDEAAAAKLADHSAGYLTVQSYPC